MHWLVSVVANNHHGLTLYACVEDEKTQVHKEQVHRKSKHWKTLLILATNVKWPSLESRVAWIMMNQGIPNHMYEVKHLLQNMPQLYMWMGIVRKFM